MTEVERIVEGLMISEKDALLSCQVERYRAWPESARHRMSFNISGRHLMALGLIEWHPNKRQTLTRLTPLGLAVREHLLSSMEKDG